MSTSINVRLTPEMSRDLHRLIKLTSYENVSTYIRALIRSEIIAYKAEGQLPESNDDIQKC